MGTTPEEGCDVVSQRSCPSCASEVATGAALCPACGEALPDSWVRRLHDAPAPYRNRALGESLRVVGWLLMVACSLAVILAWAPGRPLRLSWPLRTLGVPLLGVLGAMAVSVGRRLRQPSAEDAMRRRAGEPPVLYLRSFQTEESEVRATPRLALPGGGTVLLARAEQDLTAVLLEVGPVVAIGRPGDRIPEVGAARVYVADEEWKTRVAGLMDQAALVVLHVGQTQGFWWEVSHALRRLPASRVLFYFGHGGVDEAARREFLDRVQPMVQRPISLPLGVQFAQFDPRGELHTAGYRWRTEAAMHGALRRLFTEVAGSMPDAARERIPLVSLSPKAAAAQRRYTTLFWCGVIAYALVVLASYLGEAPRRAWVRSLYGVFAVGAAVPIVWGLAGMFSSRFRHHLGPGRRLAVLLAFSIGIPVLTVMLLARLFLR